MELKTVRLFFIIKDLMIFVIYFILLKFNITGETYSEEMMSNFPDAVKLGLLGILFASIYISWLPVLIDLIVLQTFYNFLLKNSSKINDFLTGMILNIPIVITWILFLEGQMNRTLITSLILTTFLSGFAFSKMKNKINSNANVNILDDINE